MKKFTSIILAILLCLTFASCEKEDITVTSSDDNYTVTAPGTWEDVAGKLNGSAIIELAEFKTDTYAVFIPYPAELFPTIADFAVNITQSVPKWYPDAQIQEPMAYQYDGMTYYKLYAFQQGEGALAIKFSMIYDELNYILVISYTPLDDEYKTRLDSTEAIIHSMKLTNPPVTDPALDGVGEPPAGDEVQTQQ